MLAAAAAALALGWLVWAGLAQGAADVSWSDVGFSVVDDSLVRVTYDVAKDPEDTAVCELRALDLAKGRVGTVRVTVGPTSERVTRRTDEVRTSALAVTGIVDRCTVSH